MGTVYSEEGTSKAMPGLSEHVELPDSHPELSRETAPCLGSEPASDMPHFIQRRVRGKASCLRPGGQDRSTLEGKMTGRTQRLHPGGQDGGQDTAPAPRRV
ncbi:unnamed protein product [Coccothraustes coccothraustes]